MKEGQGNLSRTGLPKVLHLIYERGEKAAVLDVIRDPIKKRFFFRDGVPVAASSNILNEVLGRLLMQEGLLTQADYERSLETVLKEKKKHGEVLISLGLLTREQLEKFLALQLKRRLWKVFSWNEGIFKYSRVEIPAEGVAGGLPHPASIILDGISLGFYPSARIKADLKDYLDSPVRFEPGEKYSLDDFRLNLQEKRFVESFDGQKTLREALEASELLRQRAVAIALSLIITGVLKAEGVTAIEPEFLEGELREEAIKEAVWDTRLNAELLFMRAKSDLAEGRFGEAAEKLREITELNPTEAEYWAYLGWALYKSSPEKADEAEKILKDAIDLNNDLDSAWHFLAMIFLSKGDEKWAEKAFRTALGKNPWHIESLSELKRLEAEKSAVAPPDGEARRAYMAAYGFTEDPFADGALPRGASFSAGQKEALENLIKAVMKKAGPVLLTAPAGSGKTSLIIEALNRLSGDKVLASAVLGVPEREIQLIKAINSEIGATSESPSVKEQLLSLGMRVSQNKIQGGTSVIFIDDAHKLTDGSLKLIQYLSRLKTLQIVLLGDPTLTGRLKSPDFSELDGKVASRLSIEPFNSMETGEFVLSRLNGAERAGGAKGGFTLTEEVRGHIFNESGGVPSGINQTAASLMAKAAKAGTYSLDSSLLAAEAVPSPGPKPDLMTIEDFITMEEIGLTPPQPEEKEEEERPLLIEEEAKEPERAEAEAAPVAPPVPVTVSPAPPPGKKAEKAPTQEAPPIYEKLPEAAPKKKKSFLRLLLWIIVMLLLGLAAGTIIGVYWFGARTAPEQPVRTAPLVPPGEARIPKGPDIIPIDASTVPAGQIEKTSTVDGSVPR